FPGVVYDDPKMIDEIEATIARNKTVTGHFPDGTPEMLQAYIASGVDSCHETVTREQGLEKARLGMHVQIREGSAWHDVKEVIKVITEDGIDSSNISLVTDDVYPQTLMEKGHLNHVVRRAIEEGVDPVEAIQLGTINTARYYHLDKELGSITPGKFADIILLDNLNEMEPTTVIANGQVVVENSKLIASYPSAVYPEAVKQTVKLQRPLTPVDFDLITEDKDFVEVNGIKVIENSARTEKMVAKLPVVDGIVQMDMAEDIIQLA